MSGPVATLDSEQTTQVIHVWTLLQTSPNREALRIPLRRWESSLTRANLEDKLIDAWISLEALLLGGDQGELAYRASIRLAEFLAASGANRQEIYEDTRMSYRWRSIIVHGLSSKKIAKRQPLEKVVQLTTDRLRSALLKVLEQPRRFDPNKLEIELLRRDGSVQ